MLIDRMPLIGSLREENRRLACEVAALRQRSAELNMGIEALKSELAALREQPSTWFVAGAAAAARDILSITSDYVPPPRAEPSLSAEQSARLREAMRAWCLRLYPESRHGSADFERDLETETTARPAFFADYVVPWVDDRVALAGREVVEVGCGTGASTAAFAPHVGRMVCFEIDPSSSEAAKQRVAICGFDNVVVHQEPFEGRARYLRDGSRADVVLLCAVLEHMTIAERLAILQTSWNALRPGGVLVVTETPNRLCPNDHHTSFVPFMHQLPHELKLAYLDRSPRGWFVEHVRQATTDDSTAHLALDRWGFGASYHEFECALGEDVHEWVIADGYEPIIAALHHPGFDDALVAFLFAQLNLKKHRAFTRYWLHLIVRKPA